MAVWNRRKGGTHRDQVRETSGELALTNKGKEKGKVGESPGKERKGVKVKGIRR